MNSIFGIQFRFFVIMKYFIVINFSRDVCALYKQIFILVRIMSINNSIINETSSNLPPANISAISIVIFLIIAILYAGVVTYIFSNILTTISEHFKEKRKNKNIEQFQKMTFELLKTPSDIPHKEIIIPRIIRIFKHKLEINENYPNFFNLLVRQLEKLELIIIDKENSIKILGFYDENLVNFYLTFIDAIISKVKVDHPYSGLKEDELLFFEQFANDLQRNDYENNKLKLIELSKKIKAKNIEIEKIEQKAKQADFYTKISIGLGILSIIEGITLYLISSQ